MKYTKLKILSAEQIRALDAFTIQNEPIASIDLMERASRVFTDWFIRQYSDEDRPIYVFCGIGNNGGDGLAVARMLHFKFYNVQVFCCKISDKTSEDFQVNLDRLPKRDAIPVVEITKGDPLPTIAENAIIIDAIFGSGLNRPVEGYWASLIDHINQVATSIAAIDIPSGLFADQHTNGTAIKAERTLSFQFPKLAFLFPENHEYVGHWEYQPIGLSEAFIQQSETINYYITPELAHSILRSRQKYDHKGTYGHALLIVGSYGKIGAALLATWAGLRSGAGLVSVHVPSCAFSILQGQAPEAMLSIDPDEHYFSRLPELKRYKAIGIGCGLDQQQKTGEALFQLLQKSEVPLVLDADALNILAQNQDWHSMIPANSILTPHPKEFERLFGSSKNQFERNQLQRQKAQKLKVYIILKGAHSCIATPDGVCYFNSTGNPGMGTGGSGDVLTGLLTGLLAQSYLPLEACILGVFLHGLAGDLAVAETGQEALIAGDIVRYFGKGFRALGNCKTESRKI